MSVRDEIRSRVIHSAQGAAMLNLAFIGITNGLFDALSALGKADAAALAEEASRDPGYVLRWCDAAYAFELLDWDGACFSLSELGASFRPAEQGSLMPFAVHSVLGAHMSERAAGLMPGGERPGESVLGERATILPWFGPMLESMFGPFFEQHIVSSLEVFKSLDDGLLVDLGCGNGWYLRRLLRAYPRMRGIGLDGFEENISAARSLAEGDGVAERADFRVGNIHHFAVEDRADLIAMNRALHHVWSEKENVFRILAEHLAPGGAAVIWEPAWPEDKRALREPAIRPMAFQNLSEHVQGNHFLRPEEIAQAFRAALLEPEIHLFAGGKEAVVVGRKP